VGSIVAPTDHMGDGERDVESVEVGIAGFGAYIPRLRVSREEIVAAHRWWDPSLASNSTSERSASAFDEDSITMAVDALRDCLTDGDRESVDSLFFGTTTAPFADRLNAGIVAGALRLPEALRAQDVTGSLRAGTSALLSAIDAVKGRGVTALCVASDRRAAPAGTKQELSTGHGAAAVCVAPGPGIARLLGTASLTVDFVDHFRSSGSEFDYHWEERWVREEGYFKLVPELIERVLAEANIKADSIDHFCLPVPMSRVSKTVASYASLPEESIDDTLAEGCGDTGAAHSVLMLVRALETAKPGEKILVVGFGQGGDALVFEATDAIVEYQRRGSGVRKWLNRRVPLAYHRYLALNGLIKVDRGIRSETDKPTAMTAAYRHSDFLLGLVGSRCVECGTRQIPRSNICANPDCHLSDTQAPEPFAETLGHVVSWSADSLTYTPDPPAYYGMIDFSGGGRLMMNFTDVEHSTVKVGLPMRMVFRIKDQDERRGFTRYFWKAAPVDPREVGVDG
jgi:3-hydroxy-3-methylglutaryl CoA synthase